MIQITKDELINKYGAEWYEGFKRKNRIRAKEKYDANPEVERKRRRERYAKDPEYMKVYRKKNREIYRINTRDRNRLTLLMGWDLEGKVLHHVKYHADNNDPTWIDDVLILTPEEHRLWHNQNPDFVASENIV